MLADRKKLFLLGLLAVVLCARVHWLTTQAARAQLKADAQQLADMELQVRARERAYEKENAARSALELTAQHCLPSASPVLVIQLQNWLIEEAEDCGLEDVVVTPMPVADAGDKLSELPFKVAATGDFESSLTVLSRIGQVPLEQRVDAISLRATGEAYEDRVEFDFSIYFLLLPDTNGLPFPDPSTIAERLTETTPAQANYVNLPSMLCAEEPPAPEVRTVANTEVAKKPPVDRTGDIRQLGTVISGTSREVWIVDTQTDERRILSEGQTFELAGVSGTVEKVTPSGVQLLIDGEPYVWKVARTMNELQLATTLPQNKPR